MQTLAITGRVGSGKSSALKICKQLGAYTMDCDEVVASLLKEPQIITQIEKAFSASVVSYEEISKKKLADIVFSDEKKLRQLENIVDPHLNQKLIESQKIAQHQGFEWFSVEVLRPKDIQFHFDRILEVEAPIHMRFKRLGVKELMNRDSFFQNVEADWVIQNISNLQDLEKQLASLLQL